VFAPGLVLGIVCVIRPATTVTGTSNHSVERLIYRKMHFDHQGSRIHFELQIYIGLLLITSIQTSTKDVA